MTKITIKVLGATAQTKPVSEAPQIAAKDGSVGRVHVQKSLSTDNIRRTLIDATSPPPAPVPIDNVAAPATPSKPSK